MCEDSPKRICWEGMFKASAEGSVRPRRARDLVFMVTCLSSALRRIEGSTIYEEYK